MVIRKNWTNQKNRLSARVQHNHHVIIWNKVNQMRKEIEMKRKFVNGRSAA